MPVISLATWPPGTGYAPSLNCKPTTWPSVVRAHARRTPHRKSQPPDARGADWSHQIAIGWKVSPSPCARDAL